MKYMICVSRTTTEKQMKFVLALFFPSIKLKLCEEGLSLLKVAGLSEFDHTPVRSI